MIYAQIKNGIVCNKIILEDDSLIKFFKTDFDYIIRIDKIENQPDIGWKFDGLNFIEIIKETDKKYVDIKQLRLALIDKEISFDKIKFFIEGLEDKQKLIYQTEWEFGSQFEINNPIIENILLGIKTPTEKIQEIWELAKEK